LWRTHPQVRSRFLGEVPARLSEDSDVLELGCGPGTTAAELSFNARRYVGVDLSKAQLAIAQRRVPEGRFVRADFTSIAFRPESFDGVVAFYAFNYVPQDELAPTFERIIDWLRPGARLMLSLGHIRQPGRDRVGLARAGRDVLRKLHPRDQRASVA
jgi:SAM-dependent methyltransferase